MANYVHGSVATSTTAVKVCSIGQIPENGGVLVQPSVDTYFGGSTVTSSGATTGVKVAANTIQLIPTTGAQVQDLYAVVGTGTGTVVFLHP
jgi:hypothetical protein